MHDSSHSIAKVPDYAAASFALELFADGTPARRYSARSIHCIGRNYADHAKELGNAVPSEPVVFLKATSSLRGLAPEPIAHPSETFHHEAELVVLIGRPLALGASAQWDDVAGLGLGLDLTRRAVQSQLKAAGLPWTRAKSFAGSAIVTPFLTTAAFADLDAIRFSLHVNDVLRQEGDTRLMLFKIREILTHLAQSTPLIPGDLVFTGTPAGVGPFVRGDRFTLAFPELERAWHGQL